MIDDINDDIKNKINALRKTLSLSSGEGTQSIGAWFLGPKGESHKLLLSMLKEALHHSIDGRESTYPEDPPWSDPDSIEYKTESRIIQNNYKQLVRNLESHSVPFSSYRYQGHMLWDQTLPSVAGYFAALLYNQNNVAAEASPVTTALEMEVAHDLCTMVGFGGEEKIEPWGHITCDGSMANIEAFWAGRNTKLYPFAVYAALKLEADLEPLNTIEVEITGPTRQKKKIIDLDWWELLNLKGDVILELPTILNCEAKKHNVDSAKLNLIKNYTVQQLGLITFGNLIDRIPGAKEGFSKALADIKIIGPATGHYSLTKAVTLLGLGSSAFSKIKVLRDARMDIKHLKESVNLHLGNKLPIMTVVCVIGTTEESAVDNLEEVLNLREEMRTKGMDFFIHADAAWGGYFASLLNKPLENTTADKRFKKYELEAKKKLKSTSPEQNFDAAVAFEQLQNIAGDNPNAHENFMFTEKTGLNEHTETQLRKLKLADSITVDPHKSGFTLYPAGSLLYRDRRMPEMIQITAPVVYHDGDAPTVGVFGVEGSKPGAAAAGIYFSHRIIRPDQSGYGKILGKCTFNAKRFFSQLVAIDSLYFKIAVLTELSEHELSIVRTWAPLSNVDLWKQLRDHQGEMELFRRTGPDLNIISYALNPVINGDINSDPKKSNDFNNTLFRKLSSQTVNEPLPEIIVTSSSFDSENSDEPIKYLRQQLGLKQDDKLDLRFLITSVMNPWLTDADHGECNMIPKLVGFLQKAAESLVHELYYKPKPDC
jgi:glutamate/tyrosine decarboxylase-like PLP-dependent enzyme